MSMRSRRQLTQSMRRPRLLTRNTATTLLPLTSMRTSTPRLLTPSMRPRQLTRTTRQRRTRNMVITLPPLMRRSTLLLLTLSMRQRQLTRITRPPPTQNTSTLPHPTLSMRPQQPTRITRPPHTQNMRNILLHLTLSMRHPRLLTRNTRLPPSTSTAHLPTQSTLQSQSNGEVTMRSPRLPTQSTLPAPNTPHLHTQNGRRPRHPLTLNTRQSQRSGQVTSTPSLLTESGRRAARHLTRSTHQPRLVDTQPGPRLQATSQSTLRKLLARRAKSLTTQCGLKAQRSQTTRLLFPRNTLPGLPVP
jgi:hypothetical protein